MVGAVIIIILVSLASIYFCSFYLSLFLFVIFGIITLVNINGYNKSMNASASKKICPSCGSSNIRIELIATKATSTSWKYTKDSPNTHTNTNIENQKTAICNDCGHTFAFYSAPDVSGIQQHNKYASVLTAIVTIINAGILIYTKFLH